MMFIQVIEGHTGDPAAMHRRMEAWERDLMPGAIGYLGSTGGCTDQGDCVIVARFQDAEAARRNSERPEQTEWWRGTEALFDGPPRFHETTEVAVMEHGELDRAHFVQVMEGHVSDRARAMELEQESDAVLAEVRPDLLGSVTAFFDDDEFVEVAYFTDETSAREGEARELPGDLAARMAEWERVMKVELYRDIKEPWLTSAR